MARWAVTAGGSRSAGSSFSRRKLAFERTWEMKTEYFVEASKSRSALRSLR